MAIASLAAMAVWLAAPDLLSPRAATAAYGAWTLITFGYLFVIIGGHRRWADIVTGVRVLLCVVLFASYALDPRHVVEDGGGHRDHRARRGGRRAGPARGRDRERRGVRHGERRLLPRHHVRRRPRLPRRASDGVRGRRAAAALRLHLGGAASVHRAAQPEPQGSQRGRIIHVSLAVALIAESAAVHARRRTVFAAIAAALISYSYAVDFWATRAAAPASRDAPRCIYARDIL